MFFNALFCRNMKWWSLSSDQVYFTASLGHLENILNALNGISPSASSASEEGAEQANTYHFIIPDGKGEKLLTCRCNGWCSLPVLSPPKTETSIWVNEWDKDPHKLHMILKASMGYDCCVVRPAWIRPDTGYGVEEVVLVMELQDKDVDLLGDSLIVLNGYIVRIFLHSNGRISIRA